MNIKVIIPARGNSKGIPKKNITLFNGKPLIQHAILSAQKVPMINEIIVSTDCNEIAKIASEVGANIIMRPGKISTDKSPSEEALLHAIEKIDKKPDIIVFIQCTSPLIEAEDIENCINKLIDSNADCAFTASPTHDFLWKDEDNAKGINHSSSIRKRRQDLDKQYVENGAIYAIKTDGFMKNKHRFFGKIVISQMPKIRSIEIDNLEDLKIAQSINHQTYYKKFPKNIKGVVFDFDGVFTNNKVYLSEDGIETVRCDRSDGWGIGKLQKLDLKLAVMSSEINPVVLKRCEKLKIECFNKLENSKYNCLEEWCLANKIDKNEIIFIGNDENDVECLKNVGCGVVPADAHYDAINVADLILQNKGGDGAVRELADLITEHKKNESK